MDFLVIIFALITLISLIAGLYIFTYSRKKGKVWPPFF